MGDTERIDELERMVRQMTETQRVVDNSLNLLADKVIQMQDHLDVIYQRQDYELTQWREFYRRVYMESGPLPPNDDGSSVTLGEWK